MRQWFEPGSAADEITQHFKTAISFLLSEIGIGVTVHLGRWLGVWTAATVDRVDRMLGWFLAGTVCIFLVSTFLKFLKIIFGGSVLALGRALKQLWERRKRQGP